MAHRSLKPDICLTFHHGVRALSGRVQATRAVTGRAGVRHTTLGWPGMRLRDSLRAMFPTQF